MSFDDESFGLDKNSELYKLLKMLSEKENFDDEESEQDLDRLAELTVLAEDQDALGPPDKIETYKEGDLTITVSYWFVPGGEIKTVDIEGDDELVSQEDLEEKIAEIISENGDLNVIGVDINNETFNPIKGQISSLEKPLEVLLDEVVLREDYDLAAKIRDSIKDRDALIQATIDDAKQMIENGDYENAKILLEKAVELKKCTYNHGF